MTLKHNIQADISDAIRNQSTALIRAELRSAEQRAILESAVRDAIVKLGCTIDAMSEASGLTPSEIRRILADVGSMDGDVAVLAGMR